MKLEAKNALLRIAIRRTEDEDTWILEGGSSDRLWTNSQTPGRKHAVNAVAASLWYPTAKRHHTGDGALARIVGLPS
jgi:hypothetical protein